ncbi:MAG TPA: hypothetical protein VHC21_03110 [Candidatus Saccharimonadales bacterium]|nr:hypothetical protein [Candidatus Saccharimonadales bacterium]
MAAESNTRPIGKYAAEKDLSSQEIVELKAKLLSDRRLIPLVCAKIAVDMETAIEKDNGKRLSRDEFAWETATTAANWANSLRGLVELPDSEWPEYMVQPAHFVEPLQEVEQEIAEGRYGG